MFDSLILALEYDPRSCGMKHPNPDWANFEIWIAQLPRIADAPAIWVLYEIDDENGIVKIHNTGLLDTSKSII